MIIFSTGCADKRTWDDFAFQTMGTVARCELELPAGLGPEGAAALVGAVYDSVNTVFNSWSPDSELSRLNRAPADSAVALSPWLNSCLMAADGLRRESGGAFDPSAGPLMDLWGFTRGQGRLPSAAERDSVCALVGRWAFSGPAQVTKQADRVKLDLGAIAKGFAVDRARERLAAAGVENGLIDLGGNLFCLGGAAGRRDWRVGVRDPLDRDRYFASVPLHDQAVATSGSYERFVTIDGRRHGHIMNTATGLPATGVLSATIIAPTAILADGLSTTIFVLGPERGGELLRRNHPEVEAILVVPGEGAAGGTGEVGGTSAPARVLFTPGLAGRLQLLPDYEEAYVLVPWWEAG